MGKLKKSVAISFGLGVASALAIVMSHLALTDIWHAREPDLSAEWRVLQVSFAVVILFHAAALTTLARVWRKVRD